MTTDTMQVRCCVIEAEQLIDQVQPLGLELPLLAETFTVIISQEYCLLFYFFLCFNVP